jgi:hypothetical protein
MSILFLLCKAQLRAPRFYLHMGPSSLGFWIVVAPGSNQASIVLQSCKFHIIRSHTTSTQNSYPREPRPNSDYFPAYLLVQSTPSFADGALARSLTMPAPVEKSTTFCQPS